MKTMGDQIYGAGDHNPDAPSVESSTLATQRTPMYRFTKEELAVLEECNNESFFQRSLPIGTSLGIGSYLAVQKGYFKASARYGAWPKVAAAVVVGYFLGKISYQQICAEKLMALPNSHIGQVLRNRYRKGSPSQEILPGASPMFGLASSDIYSDASPGTTLNMDTDRPLFTNEHPIKLDSLLPETDLNADGRSSLSYDELRKKNRGEYSDNRQDPYKVPAPASAPIITRPASIPQPRNKYGDIID